MRKTSPSVLVAILAAALSMVAGPAMADRPFAAQGFWGNVRDGGTAVEYISNLGKCKLVRRSGGTMQILKVAPGSSLSGCAATFGVGLGTVIANGDGGRFNSWAALAR